MKLTGFEKETIIVFNEAEKTAIVCTFSKKIIKKLMAVKDSRDDITLLNITAENEHKFEIPKSWVKVTPKQIRKLLTETQKQAFRDRMEHYRLYGKNSP